MTPVTINEKGGKVYRKYTEDTLRTIYSTSALGANYEVSVLVENAVFMMLFIYFSLHEKEIDYFDFVIRKRTPSLGDGLQKLRRLDIFDKDLIVEIEKYKSMRDKFIHDPFKAKSFVFGKSLFSVTFEETFEQGMKVLEKIGPYIRFGFPDMETFKKKYQAETDRISFEIKIVPVLLKLAKTRLELSEAKPTKKNAEDLTYVVNLLEEETTQKI